MMCGGTSDVKQASEELQSIVDQTRDDFESKANQKFDDFTATQYKSQVVAGTNYFVKVRIGEDSFAHVKIFVPLPYTNEAPKAQDIRLNHTSSDPIEYF